MAPSDPERAHACERVEGESKGQTPAPVTEPCLACILTCADGSYYVGSTSDLAERERIHNEGHGAKHAAAGRLLSGWSTQKPTSRPVTACVRER
jgi:hypothetical protein